MRKTEKQGSEQEQHEQKNNDFTMIEAALYVSGRPLDINELCAALKTRSRKRARKVIDTIIKEYSHRNTALEILELKDERFVLQLKAEFTPLVRKLVNRPLLSSGPLKTLSYIAYRQPVSQKRVIDVRGHHAYGHVKVLKEIGLIAGERTGRSMLLKTTDYFADYFGLSLETSAMKRELKSAFETSPEEESQEV